MNPRSFREEDAAAIAALIAADEELHFGRPGRVTATEILRYIPWNKEAWVWEEGGRIVASATFGVNGESVAVQGVVGDKGRGLGTEILDRGEAFARAEGAERVLASGAEPDHCARSLFEARGYREVRRFYEMAIELVEEPVVPELPDGLVLDALRDDEYRAFFEALNEAFAEHWEWHPRPFDEWYEHRQGQHRDERGPVWFVIRDGDELAAVTRNDAGETGGYVGAIGVRPAWRGKGLAKALLFRTFAEFWRRGTPEVRLDVDSQNATGAVALYERVGMRVETCGIAYEKALA